MSNQLHHINRKLMPSSLGHCLSGLIRSARLDYIPESHSLAVRNLVRQSRSCAGLPHEGLAPALGPLQPRSLPGADAG